ncbi:hypothetical protein SNE40_018667 [Patella caerulea]|uniref:Uncharacterized protein n=1 Tax=Patella caerulea TaxID=87958 RepID=A0AAN8J5B4_PATCE
MASISTTIVSTSTTTGTNINTTTQSETATTTSSSSFTAASTTTLTTTTPAENISLTTATTTIDTTALASSLSVIVILAVIVLVMFILWRIKKQNKRKNKAVGKLPDINAIQMSRGCNQTASVGQTDPVIEIEDETLNRKSQISTNSSIKSNYYDANKFPVKLKKDDSFECVKQKEPIKQTESVPCHEAPPIPCVQSKPGYVNLPVVDIINESKQTPEYKNLNGTENSIYVNNEMIIQQKTDSNSNYYENTNNSPLYYNQEEENQGFEIGEDYENAPKKKN